MYKGEKFNNSCESTKEGNCSQISNIFDYTSHGKTNSLTMGSAKERSIQLNDEKDIYSVEREICNTQLDNIREEEIVIKQMVEYYVPTTINCKFSEMFDKSERDVKKRESEEPVTPNIAYSHLFSNKTSTYYDSTGILPATRVSENSLKPIKSKSLTHLDYSASKRLKQEHKNKREPIKKYSNKFLNNERTLKELKQQNMLAQDLLQKYFKDDEQQTKTDNFPRRHHIAKRNYYQENQLDTVSRLMKRYFSRIDENEQVCIKPSDEYVFLSTKDTSKKNSVKFIRPFKYHKKYWDSGSNFDMISKTESPFKFEGHGRKRSRLEFESNMALKHDSSTDVSLKTQNVQFLTTGGGKRVSDSEANKILFKTDSKDFENSYSLEELHFFMPERYKALQNLYSSNIIENTQEQNKSEQSKPRYNFQTLPNKNSKSHMKFFDSGSHIKITDDDYKKWLKEKNFLKYTDCAKSSVSSVTFKSISQKIVNYSITPFCKPNREKKKSRTSIMNKSHQIGFSNFANAGTIPSLTNSTDNYKFVDIEYNNLYQLVIYEHIVISNLINFYCSFNATRIRKLTIKDRMYQLMFLVFCYYVLLFMNNNIFNPFDERWF